MFSWGGSSVMHLLMSTYAWNTDLLFALWLDTHLPLALQIWRFIESETVSVSAHFKVLQINSAVLKMHERALWCPHSHPESSESEQQVTVPCPWTDNSCDHINIQLWCTITQSPHLYTKSLNIPNLYRAHWTDWTVVYGRADSSFSFT